MHHYYYYEEKLIVNTAYSSTASTYFDFPSCAFISRPMAVSGNQKLALFNKLTNLTLFS